MLSPEERRRQILIWTSVTMFLVIVGWIVTLKWELSANKKNDNFWQEIFTPFKEIDLNQDLQKIKTGFNQLEEAKNLSSTTSTLDLTTSTPATSTPNIKK